MILVEKILDRLNLLYPLLDFSLVEKQTDLYKGSSAMLKFDICFCFSAQVYLFSLLLYFSATTSGRKF